MKTISNEQLTIQVSPYGAELCSILANGKEYLWQSLVMSFVSSLRRSSSSTQRWGLPYSS